ncbi:MAG: hypothetical protein K0S79_1454, partial [Nitrospira sp.]|nr:hypothetical protein [Nitrospira sp.]
MRLPPTHLTDCSAIAFPGRAVHQQGRREGGPRGVVERPTETQFTTVFSILLAGPGDPAAPKTICLPLLPSGPGGIHRVLLHRAQPLNQAAENVLGFVHSRSSLYRSETRLG